MHPNASITKERQDTSALFSAMLLTVSSDVAEESGAEGGEAASGGEAEEETGPEAVVDAACSLILSKLPKDLDVTAREALTKFPVSYQESMNTVVVQELGRFAGLLKIIEVRRIFFYPPTPIIVISNSVSSFFLLSDPQHSRPSSTCKKR